VELNDDDPRARIEALRERGEQLQRQNEQTQRDILTMLEIPEHGAVVARFDANGLMSALEIDSDARKVLSAQQFVREVNMAILRATGIGGASLAATAGDPQSELSASSRTFDLVAKAISSDQDTEPKRISNDFKTVTVIALWGNVAGVECSNSWIDSTPDRLIAEEIVRMARTVAIETDPLQRFDEQGRMRNG
jgi:hypothetical protein